MTKRIKQIIRIEFPENKWVWKINWQENKNIPKKVFIMSAKLANYNILQSENWNHWKKINFNLQILTSKLLNCKTVIWNKNENWFMKVLVRKQEIRIMQGKVR